MAVPHAGLFDVGDHWGGDGYEGFVWDESALGFAGGAWCVADGGQVVGVRRLNKMGICSGLGNSVGIHGQKWLELELERNETILWSFDFFDCYNVSKLIIWVVEVNGDSGDWPLRTSQTSDPQKPPVIIEVINILFLRKKTTYFFIKKKSK